jgi:hypothetical protein
MEIDGDIDETLRTVKLTFSSEVKVPRYYGIEILSHDKESVDLARLRNGAPFLYNHNIDNQLGIVEDSEIGADKRGHAIVRFSKSQRADEYFQDVVDGIRKNISTMYEVSRMEEQEDDEWLVTRWAPLEISLVTIPADITVGIGRSLESEIETKIYSKRGNVLCLDNSLIQTTAQEMAEKLLMPLLLK